MSDDWAQARLGDFIRLDVEKVDIRPGETLELAGVFSFGRGLFRRDPLDAEKTSYKQVNRLRTDRLVLSKLKAWEGAIAVVGPRFDGAVLSPEFPTFAIDTAVCSPDYMRLVCTVNSFWELLASTKTGMGGRKERVNPSRILDLELGIPSLRTQQRIVDLVGAIDQTVEELSRVVAAGRTVVATMSAELIPWGHPDTPLGDVCSIESRLVDPTSPEYSDLPHVGVDRIVSGDGRLLPTESAAVDGVTSGKHLFTPEDVVYSKIRPELRKVALPGYRGLCSADAYPLRPGPRMHMRYLYELLLSEGFAERSVAKSGRTKMPKINRQELFSIEVEVPPLEEQLRVSEVLGAFRSYLDHVHIELRAGVAVRSAMVEALLSGAEEIPHSYDQLLESAS